MAPSRRHRSLSYESDTNNATAPFMISQLQSLHALLETHPWHRRLFSLFLLIMVTGYPSFTSYSSVQFLLKSPLPHFIKRHIAHSPVSICSPAKPYITYFDTAYYQSLQQQLNISDDASMSSYLHHWLCAVPPDVTDPKSLVDYYRALEEFNADVGSVSGYDNSVDEANAVAALRQLEAQLLKQKYQTVESAPLHIPPE